MPRVLAFGTLFCVLATAVTHGSEDLRVVDPDGETVRWHEVLSSSGPAAVLVVSSWSPDGPEALNVAQTLARTASDRGLAFLVVDVQEGFDDAEKLLEGRGLQWYHDRHGAILKAYRLIEVPVLIVVDGDGRLQATMSPDDAALRAWVR